MKPNLYTAYGKTLTIKEWYDEPECQCGGSSFETLRQRVKTRPIEEALAAEPRRGQRVTIDGETKSLIEWVESDRCTVQLSSVCNRITDGWDVVDAILTDNKLITTPYITAWSEDKTFNQWLKDDRCVIGHKTTYYRRVDEEGMTPEEALSTPVIIGNLHTAWGETKTAKEWAKDNRVGDRVTSKIISERINVYGWPVERSISEPKPELVLYSAFGEEKTLHEWIKDDRCVIASSSSLKSRIEQGIPFEEALTKEISGCSSFSELAVGDFIESLGFKIIRNTRRIISPKELDIYIPEKKIAVEYNGVYWHREEEVGDQYHYDKWRMCEEKGIQLIHIWEDDWDDRPDAVKVLLRDRLGVLESEIPVDETVVDSNISSQEAKEFLDFYHIKGFIPADYYYGLRHEDKLVALCSLKDSGDGFWVVTRFVASCSVVGGFSKLLEVFRSEHPGPVELFADLCVADLAFYKQNGFTLEKFTYPDYSYIVHNKRADKSLYQIDRFKSDPDLLYEENLTEAELAELNGLERVYDAGKIRYLLQ